MNGSGPVATQAIFQNSVGGEAASSELNGARKCREGAVRTDATTSEEMILRVLSGLDLFGSALLRLK